MNALTPRETVSELDRYIVGQDKAKRAVAVAMRKWQRQARRAARQPRRRTALSGGQLPRVRWQQERQERQGADASALHRAINFVGDPLFVHASSRTARS